MKDTVSVSVIGGAGKYYKMEITLEVDENGKGAQLSFRSEDWEEHLRLELDPEEFIDAMERLLALHDIAESFFERRKHRQS